MSLRISALEYVQKVTAGEFTAAEFAAATLERIRDVEPRLHAYLDIQDEEAVMASAREVDKKIRSGRRAGACMGMPIAVKDNICVRGRKTTCGSRMLEGFVAPYDATVAHRLLREDAILVANANMDEFAMGLTTEFSAFGPSRNPWNTACVPGGSSGGSAAATAAYECVASIGTDTGGSVRNPASFCSVVGYKPTYGLVSRYGIVSYANSIEQAGPITRTVKDAAFLLGVMAGRDDNDDTTFDPEDTDYLGGIDDGIDGMRVGIIREMMEEGGADPEVIAATRDAIRRMEKAGASCEEVSLDMVKYSVPAYYTITAAEAESNLARYDNIRYGYDDDNNDDDDGRGDGGDDHRRHALDGYAFDSYIAEARSRFGPEAARRIIVGGYVSSAGHSGRYYNKAQKVRAKLTREVGEALERHDVLVSPTVPLKPFRIGEKIDDPVALFMLDLYTVTANLTGKPSISVPYAISDDGLPIGVQIMAYTSNDKMLLRAARALEQARGTLPEVPI